MTRPCSTCGNLGRNTLGYRCDALRLRDPQDELTHIPTRTMAQPAHFEYGVEQIDSEVRRTMSPGSVEGWYERWQDRERVPCTYRVSDCPAWRHK